MKNSYRKTQYYTHARLFPALLASFPFLLIYFTTIGTKVHEFISYVWYLQPVADISFSAVIIYGLIQCNRFISKEIFERNIFNDGMDMPTTRYLLYADETLDLNSKDMIRNKIKEDFNIDLLSKAEEEKDGCAARKQIGMALSQVRKALINNEMVLRCNIEYGFVRNLIGGSLLAFFVSVINCIVFYLYYPNNFAFNTSVALFCIYLLILVASRFILKRYGHYYAKTLFEQFIN